jgi:mannosyltransferase
MYKRGWGAQRMAAAGFRSKALEALVTPRALLVLGAVTVTAALVYFFRLSVNSLGASEAYSALAASKPSVAAIVAIPLNHDPGKVVGYYAALHYWTALFGTSEAGLRSFSAAFAVADILLLFFLGREMFDDKAGGAAAAAWALAPFAVAFARRARMYSFVVALALAHLLTFWRTRSRPSAGRAVVCGMLGAALVYAHLGGFLVIGAEALMLVRDWIAKRRALAPWLALAIALTLLMPMVPIIAAQSEMLARSGWLNWIAPASRPALWIKLVSATLAFAIAAWLVFGGSFESRADEPVRWLLAWAALAPIALEAGSVLVRPMFNLRYVAPSLAVCALLVPQALAMRFGTKTRNLAVASFAVACLILVRFSFRTGQPWREIAQMVSAGGSGGQPVIFETGFVSHGPDAGRPNDGFPFGYYIVPFDYYFRGDNPRLAVPGYDSKSARRIIEERMASAGGGWLVSWKTEAEAASELPDPARFRSTVSVRADDLVVYRIEEGSQPGGR